MGRILLIFRTALIFIAIFVFSGPSLSAPGTNISTEDMLISSTLKTMAKMFVSGQDKDKLIVRLNSMDEQKFQRRYARAYTVIKDSPLILERYRFTKDMAKPEIIAKIKTMDKKQMLESIDALADAAIATQLKLYLLEKKQTLQKTNAVEQIVGIWNKLIK
jgi:hypothetical protein